MITMASLQPKESPRSSEDIQKENLESKLANAIVSQFQQKGFSQIYREALYQDYKFGGSADLLLRNEDEGRITDYLFELKGKALREDRASRQIQKMKNCFYKDWALENYLQEPADFTIFEVCFYPSKQNLKHVLNHYDLYNNHAQDSSSSSTIITFRHPQSPGIPVPIVSSNNSIKSTEWYNYWKNFQHLFEFDIKNLELLRNGKEGKN